ncbi:hypothetical protein BGX27_003299 [Mortierella sp. AM989]|nr:hypothetical protein BGX27_003299 [Mortierella sp. AM989]
MSLILAGIFIFFTAKVFPLANEDSGQFLIRVVEGTNVFLAFMLVVESTMAVVVVRREKIDRPLDDVPTSRGNAGATENSANGIQEPPQIHIYQPRLDLPPSGQRGRGSSALSGESTTGAAQSSADQSYRINILEREDSIGNEGLELELLPKYQRRRPAQSVTIVDLSNLQGVDPAVLNSVLGESVHEIQGQAQQNGQHIVCVEALDMAEAPAYSPPLTSSGGSRITNDTPNVTEGTAEEPSTLQLSPPLSSAEADTPLSTPNTATVTSSIHVSVPLATALYEPPTYMP